MNFDEMVEQEAPVQALRQSVLTGRIGHAYLFCGQRGTGKTSIARIFSRAINCENPKNGNPCNACAICKGSMDGSLMDVIEIDAASNRSIENIRKICEEVNYTPTKAKHKVYIIDEVHMITGEAFNALLKTLEEPPKHAVFLFATTDPQKIPATILSRCQRYDFRRISTASIASRLKYICDEENIKADKEALALIASLSDGAMRDAISVLDQAASAANGKTISAEFIESMTGTVNITFLAEMAEILIKGSFDRLIQKTQELSDSGRDLIQFTLDLAGFFRNLLVIRTVPDPSPLISASPTTLKRMYEVANLASAETIVAFISSLSKLVSDLKWTPSVKTTFEIGLLRFCGRKMKMDVVPLSIPDFVEKQSAASKAVSSPAPEADVKKPEEKKAEEKPAEKAEEKFPEKKPSPFDKKEAEPEKKQEEKPAGKIEEPAKAPAEEPAKPADPISSIKAKLDLMKSTLPKPSEAPKTETSTDNKAEEKKEPEKKIPSIMLPKTDVPASKLFDHPLTGSTGTAAAAPVPPIASSASAPAPAPAPEAPADMLFGQAPSDDVPPPEPPPVDPEDIPLENQMDIFSMASEPAKPSAPEVKAENPKPSKKSGKKGILADLSDSFFDDVDLPPAPSEPESPVYQPTGRIGETKKTALSAALDNTEIASVKNVDPLAVWDRILIKTADTDYVIYSLLKNADFRIHEDCAYIVVPDEDKEVIARLRKDNNFRKTSTEIKTGIENINKVFLATESQFRKTTGGSSDTSDQAPAPSTPQEKAQELLRFSDQMGIDTEIHFGDD